MLDPKYEYEPLTEALHTLHRATTLGLKEDVANLSVIVAELRREAMTYRAVLQQGIDNVVLEYAPMTPNPLASWCVIRKLPDSHEYGEDKTHSVIIYTNSGSPSFCTFQSEKDAVYWAIGCGYLRPNNHREFDEVIDLSSARHVA